MSTFVDTSVFALNIATGLSLGLAVDYALLLVSRYREEIASGGATREAHRRTVRHGRAHRALLRLHRRRGDGGAGDPATAVPLLDRGRGSLGRGALGGDCRSRRSLDAVPARNPHRRALDSPRAGRLRRVGRLVPARTTASCAVRSRSHWRAPALLLAAASPLLWTTLTGPSAQAVPPGKPSYEANSYVEAHYPRDVNEAVTVTVDGRAGDCPARRLPAPDHGCWRRSPWDPLRARLRAASPTPTSPWPARRWSSASQDSVQGDPRAGAARPRRRRWSPATPPASSIRSRAWSNTCRCSSAIIYR